MTNLETADVVELPYMVQQDEPDEQRDPVQVQAPAGKGPETAQALLAAAAKLGFAPSVVATADGHFLVPAEVADEAEGKLPEGDAVVNVTDPSVNGSDFPADDEAPEFASKAEAKAFAKAHDLDVADANADEYKAAVTEAYAAKRAAQ